MRYFDFTLDAANGQVAKVTSPGNYFFLRSASSVAQAVRVRAEKGGVDAVLLAGEGVRIPVTAGEWTIETFPVKGVALTGNVVIGSGEFISQRFSGSVDINGVTNNGFSALNVSADAQMPAWGGKRWQLDNATQIPGNASILPTGNNTDALIAILSPNTGITAYFSMMRLKVLQFATTGTAPAVSLSVGRTVNANQVLGAQFATGRQSFNVYQPAVVGTYAAVPAANISTVFDLATKIYEAPFTAAEKLHDIPLPDSGMAAYSGGTNIAIMLSGAGIKQMSLIECVGGNI